MGLLYANIKDKAYEDINVEVTQSSISKGLLKTARETIPMASKNSRSKLFWNSELSRLVKTKKKAHSDWVIDGKPTNLTNTVYVSLLNQNLGRFTGKST